MAAVRCGEPLLVTGSHPPPLVVGRAGTGGASPLGRLAKALGQKRSAPRALAGIVSRPVGAEVGPAVPQPPSAADRFMDTYSHLWTTRPSTLSTACWRRDARRPFASR